MFRITIAVAALIASLALSFSASAQENSTSQVGYSSMTDTCTLPAPKISDAEIATIEKAGDDYIAARNLRIASTPLPRMSRSSVETLFPNNLVTINEWVYSKKISVDERIQSLMLEELASKNAQQAQTTTTSVVIGW
ncbi:MAG: hypothetical protein PHE24_02470 [Patescibacteria group bacterium]|nr:hypothetical protein [Patescibacteria group bacterium]